LKGVFTQMIRMNKRWLIIGIISCLAIFSNGIGGLVHRAYAVSPITTAITGGDGFSLSLDKSGTVWGWGNNSSGTLGNGTTLDSLSPVKVSGLSGKTITAISARFLHSLALASNGTVWAWGNNSFGQLGNNSVNDSSSPVQVMSGLAGKTVTAIATGMSHSLALTSAGTVYAWGNNENGQLGVNSTTSRAIPVQVTGFSGKTIKAIAAGNSFSMALATDGSVWAWGYNSSGQLGDGTNTTRLLPVILIGLSGKNITAIAAGNNHALALAADNSVWAVGANNSGQLGDGTYTNRSAWVRVKGLTDVTVKAIAAANDHSYLLNLDGTVFASGENDRGQLGDGFTANRYLPDIVTGLSGINTISSGATNGLAVDTNGVVWSWGGNDYGQLGNMLKVDSMIAVASKADLAEAVSIDKAALAIGYKVGDSATSVTYKLTLPTAGVEGSTISWLSSDETILSNSGDVTRQEDDDKDITLTASLTKGSISDTRIFTVKVIQTDIGAVNDAKAALPQTVVYATYDHSLSVTKDIYLPTTGIHNTTVQWAVDGSFPTVISAAGKVIRPNINTVVTLKATISRNSTQATLDVPLTVLGQTDLEAVNEVKDAMVVGLSSGDTASMVTKNLTLPTPSANGITVLWHSNDIATITNNGVVTAPADMVKTVTLTADISRNVNSVTSVTYSIELTVPQTIVGSIAVAKAVLDIGYNNGDSINSVTQSLTLPSVGSSGTTVTWVSDTPSVVSATTGAVTRQASGNKTVKLTATINKNSSSTPQTKVFTLTVNQTDVGAVASTKAALIVGFGSGDSLVKVTKNVTLPLSGVNGTTISWISSDNTIIDPANGTVTRQANADTFVTLTAKIQKNGGNDATKEFKLKVWQTDDGAVAATLEALTKGFNDSNNRTIFAIGNSKTNATKKLTLPLTNVYGAKITWTTVPTVASVPPVAAAISNTGVVTRNANGDRSVDITATVYKNTTNSETFTVIVPQSEAGAIAQAKAALVIDYTGSDNATNVTDNVTLRTSGANNTSITWATSNKKAITTAGVVTRQANANTKVVLTATISKNGVRGTAVFSLTVPQTDLGAIASAKTGVVITYSKGDKVTSVTQDVYFKTIGTNGTKISWSSSNDAVITSNGLVKRSSLNDENVTLTAKIWKADINTFSEKIFVLKVLQTEVGVVAKAKTDLTLAYIDNTTVDINAVTKNLKLATKNANGATITWAVDSANSRVISRSGAVSRQLDGNRTVTLTATITKNKTKATQDFRVTVLRSDLGYVRLDKEALEITYASGESNLSVTKNITLSSSGSNGTIITWTSSNQTVINNTGVVTPLGNKDSKVTLTATIKKNAATERKTFSVTVPQTDAGGVGAAKLALRIAFAKGDKEGNVTQKLTLPRSGASGVTISWNSLKQSVISNSGDVTRQASDDTVVQLVATLERNGVNDTKSFNLTVPQAKEGAVAMANAVLAIGLSIGDSDLLHVTKKVTLPVTGTNGTRISWHSSMSNVISASGGVIRQAGGDTDVTLTATIKKKEGLLEYTENKQFTIKVLQSDAGAIAAANAALVVGYSGADSASSVTQNVYLIGSGTNGTAITWSSSNVAVISNSGVIAPIAGKKTTVRLTATITKNGIKGTKVFTLIV
jgi:alpha-tubulin suppressor-like RCC1 family protein